MENAWPNVTARYLGNAEVPVLIESFFHHHFTVTELYGNIIIIVSEYRTNVFIQPGCPVKLTKVTEKVLPNTQNTTGHVIEWKRIMFVIVPLSFSLSIRMCILLLKNQTQIGSVSMSIRLFDILILGSYPLWLLPTHSMIFNENKVGWRDPIPKYVSLDFCQSLCSIYCI